LLTHLGLSEADAHSLCHLQIPKEKYHKRLGLVTLVTNNVEPNQKIHYGRVIDVEAVYLKIDETLSTIVVEHHLDER